ncbi:MAG: HAD hydrolase-like protein [Treponema sp.]|nr:HAD hydrolase-like protein [Treponema sp.]
MACKPDPAPVRNLPASLDRAPRDTLFAGDSEADIESARNSGRYPLAVSWGSRAALEAAGAARIIDSPGELWEVPGR